MSKFSEIITYITPEQCRQAAAFLDDSDKLIRFFVASYNDYVEMHSEARLSVITNPNALFRTKEQEDRFLFEFRQYIRDVAGLPHKEEVKNGNNTSNSTRKKTVNK